MVREGLLQGARRRLDGVRQGDHARLPEAGEGVPPRRQPGLGGALQGDQRRLRRPRRRREAQGVRRGPRARAGRRLRRRARRRRRRHLPHGGHGRPGRPLRRSLRWRRRPDAHDPARPAARRRHGGAAAPVLPGRGARRHDVGQRAPGGALLELPRQRRGAGHVDAHLPALRRDREPQRQPGPVLPQHGLPGLHGPRARCSTRPARSATARAPSSKVRSVKVRIPAGVEDGQRIRVKGRGAPGQGMAPAGRPLRGRPRGQARRSSGAAGAT